MSGKDEIAARGENEFRDRSDSIEMKLALLAAARQSGDYRLAAAIADSLKDGLEAESLLQPTAGATSQVGTPGPTDVADQSAPADLALDRWQPVATLPAAWSAWAAGWNWCQIAEVSEPAGLERVREPVDVAVEIPAAWGDSLARELRVALVDRDSGQLGEVPSQVYDELRTRDAVVTDAPEGSAPLQVTAERGIRRARLAWQASVAPHGTARFVVFAGNPAAELPDYLTDLSTRGEGFALEIENAHFVASLSHQMGQLERLRYKRAHGHELYAGGEGHGEPPHIDWAHDYLASNGFQKFRVTNWETCRNFEVVRGPICTIVRRWGFPHSPLHPVFTAARMFVDVRYVFYAGVPYFTKDGRMQAVQDFSLNYLRDDEWVFSGYSFTDLLWMNEAGQLQDGPVPKEQATRMWGVGFYHRQSRDAFFSIRLDHRLERRGDPSAGGQVPGATGGQPDAASTAPEATLYHADAPSVHYPGHGQLWSRWALRGDPQLRAGDTLVQRNAYLTESFPSEAGAARFENWRHRLLQPLAVKAIPATQAAPTVTNATGNGALARPGEAPAALALKRAIWDALRGVPDDMFYKVHAGVVDMGYVYDVRLRNGSGTNTGSDVEVVMTMPHQGRPKYRYLGNPMAARVAALPGVRSVTITPAWDPAWTPHRMSDTGWQAMGLDGASQSGT